MKIHNIFCKQIENEYFLKENVILLHARGNMCILQIVFSKKWREKHEESMLFIFRTFNCIPYFGRIKESSSIGERSGA